ncbi:hypothetical protein GGI23_002174 [Coemansia sp. RSA 2559]|nr:hypothetical protein GGI23_002174 [Coemansia sp. RSA 2559]
MVQWFNPAGVRSMRQMFSQPHLLMPHMAVPDIRSIPYELLRDRGIKYVVFDKDNCLTAPYVDQIHPEFIDAWRRCRAVFPGPRVLIVSNSAGTPDDTGDEAAKKVEAALGVPVLRHRTKKPGCGSEVLDGLCGLARVPVGSIGPDQVAVVGDRLATDVLLANKTGMLSVWTRNIITTKGDNAVASLVRRLEHGVYEVLKGRGVQAPAHTSGLSKP